MINKGAWGNLNRRNVPTNRRPIDSKWAFKKKIDDQFRANLVIQEYTQIKRVGFTENCQSVVNDIKLCAILLMWLINK